MVVFQGRFRWGVCHARMATFWLLVGQLQQIEKKWGSEIDVLRLTSEGKPGVFWGTVVQPG